MTLANTSIRHTGTLSADQKTTSIQVLSDTAAVGDRLMAVLYAADVSVAAGTADASAFTLPAGWTVTSLTSLVPTGDPRRLSGAIMVAEKTVTVAGIDASTFTWASVQWKPMKLYNLWPRLTTGVLLSTYTMHTASLTTMRFTSIRGTKTQVVARLANQPMTYPAVMSDYPVTGHVVRIGAIKQQPSIQGVLLAPGHTQRASFTAMEYGGTGSTPRTGYTAMNISTQDITTADDVAAATASARGDGVALTLLVTAVVKPQVSFITPPTGASVDMSVGFPVTWTAPTEGVQQFVSIYRETPPGSGSGVMWWNGSAWQSGATAVALTGQSATLPGFAATNGTIYRYLLAVWTDNAPDWSDYAAIDIKHRVTPSAPTITITPTPVSGVVASRVPTMAVSGTVTDGGSIAGWEARWTDSTGAVVLQSKSGASASFPWVLTVPLPNNTAVRAQARFSQAGGTQWSAWANVPLTITVAKPAAPAVTFATVLHPVSSIPLPQLTVTAAAGVTVRVERGGVTVGEVVSTGPSVAIVDLAADSGPVTWSVTTLAAAPYSERSLVATVTNQVTSDGGWVFDPTRPETAVLAHPETMDAISTDLRTAVFDPLGEPFPLVQPGTPAAPRSAMTLQHRNPAVIDAAVTLLKSGATLILRGWPEEGVVASRQPDITFRPAGEIQVSRMTQGPFGYRRVAFGFVTVPPVQAGLGVIP